MACNHTSERSDREGTGQPGRFPVSLDPVQAPLDQRGIEELLVYAAQYAGQVRYFEAGAQGASQQQLPAQAQQQAPSYAQQPKGPQQQGEEPVPETIYTWQPFFEQDIAVVAAGIVLYKQQMPTLRKEYVAQHAALDRDGQIKYFRALITSVISLMRKVQEWHGKSIPQHSLQAVLEVKITSALVPALEKLIALDKAINHNDWPHAEGYEYNEDRYASFQQAPWSVQIGKIKADTSVYTGATAEDKLKHAALYVDDAFQAVSKVISELTDRSEQYFTEAIEKYPFHQPHMGLFITFLRLFGHAQQEMNKLTGRHLEFYYRDVLRLHEKKASPDAVYLIYELAKEAAEYELTKDTKLSAGKDATGKELIYATETGLVVNKAKVADLKTLYFDNWIVAQNGDGATYGHFPFAAPVARSADGNGTPFKEPEGAWPALGYFNREKDATGNDAGFIGHVADIGFAIASPQLLLKEGERTIRLKLDLDPSPETILFNEYFEVWLTGEKGWIKIDRFLDSVPELTSNTSFLSNGTYTVTGPNGPADATQAVIFIGVAEQAVVAYDPKLHGGDYNTRFPVMQVFFRDSAHLGEYLEDKIKDLTITVEVKGVRDLIIENDLSALDPAKAFDPFTAQPRTGNSFYIGSREVFFKKISALKVQCRLIAEMADKNSWVNIALLNDKQWKYAIEKNDEEDEFGSTFFIQYHFDEEMDVFNKEDEETDVQRVVLDNHRETNDQHFPVKEKALSGFMRMDLVSVTGNDITFDQGKVTLPPTFTIKDLSVSYTSEQRFETGIDQFFHLYPFGVAEINTDIHPVRAVLPPLPDAAGQPLPVATTYLLPQVRFGSNNDNLTGENQYKAFVEQQGNLYIGIEGMKPPGNLSLLFKIADGTAGDNDEKPPVINWSYLCGNEWKPLPASAIVSDSTYGLQTTGIILFDFPVDATNNNTIITKGLHWLCASVDTHADRIPRLIDVIAQAGKAVFTDQQNDPEHYRKPLPAHSVSKLVNKVAEIKSVQQPYESMDGKMREEGREFYTRASERLRHRNRAVTPWDYERLVLEKFPAIYKVKCITHTDPQCLCRHVEGIDTKCCCAQVAPGHVLIVPVSNLRNKNAVDILKPKTGRRTLLQIEEYLQKLTSPFVHVHAKNPLFEEVKTSFAVSFKTGTDKGRYLTTLNEDIIRFLTPWAFDPNSDIRFGNTIYASHIINFIEERPYVDYITNFRLLHIVKGCCARDSTNELRCEDVARLVPGSPDLKTEIRATSPRAILTSVKKHCITLIKDDEVEKECHCK